MENTKNNKWYAYDQTARTIDISRFKDWINLFRIFPPQKYGIVELNENGDKRISWLDKNKKVKSIEYFKK
jgi:hypothetical protein